MAYLLTTSTACGMEYEELLPVLTDSKLLAGIQPSRQASNKCMLRAASDRDDFHRDQVLAPPVLAQGVAALGLTTTHKDAPARVS